MRRWIAPGCLVGCLVWGVAASVAQSPPLAVPGKPLQDGCQRNFAGVIFLKSPEWVYVNRDPTLRVAEGVVRVSHVAKDDAPGEHASFDYVANLVLAPADRYLLAGDPAAMTGNFSPGSAGDREELGRLHIEWESGVVPGYAWPVEGDTAKVWGSWIWDCGHWTDAAGRLTGERTEFHPLTALAVTRRAPYLPSTTQSETDVFVSSQGTGARAVEQCALSQVPISATEYGPDFRTCVQADPRANRAHDAPQPIAGDYSFFIPAPPRPSKAARLVYHAVQMIPDSSGSERTEAMPTGIAVTVTLNGQPSESRPLRYGKSFFVGWSGHQRAKPTPLKVTFKTLTIRDADPGHRDPKGGRWNLYVELNGARKLLNDWVPALSSVKDGAVLTINRTVPINVPPGRAVNVLVFGRECDVPSGAVVLGEFAPVVAPCPANTDEPGLALSNDDPGLILERYRTATVAVGAHVSASVATTERFPGSGRITFGDGKQGNDAYELSYTIRRG